METSFQRLPLYSAHCRNVSCVHPEAPISIGAPWTAILRLGSHSSQLQCKQQQQIVQAVSVLVDL